MVDQLKAYVKHPDPFFYTQRFIDGLQDDIKAVVLIQHPKNLDIAFVLAELQEEALGLTKKPYRHFEAKPAWPGALPLPPPPPKPVAMEPKRLLEAPSSTVEEKFQSLRASRRARGLCIRCGAKWSCDHKCSEMVQLHVVQEILDMFPEADEEAAESSPTLPTHSQVMMHLSVAVVAGAPAPKTLYLQSTLQDLPLSILVDSGSSHTFISTRLAGSLQCVQTLVPAVQVQVANGALLQCNSYIPNASWSVKGYSFTTDIKLLPLTAYDMILGLDWLSSFSPMHIDWQHKWIAIPYHGQSAMLLGDVSELPVGSVVQLSLIQPSSEASCSKDVELPPALSELLSEFESLFQPPIELPPRCACDHSIPLVEGAQPVYIRPYRYAPMLKSEIERQVGEMLQQGIIQKSSSAFSSPVLLVKKKDGTWRFCVDNRHLNAIIVKGKYPVPIIDELLDELSGVAYFTSLDLQAGFHQIRMKSGEEFKTAFQTHFGQFEFCVMAFGLTGAPGSFQDAMNTTLAPYCAALCWSSSMTLSFTAPPRNLIWSIFDWCCNCWLVISGN